MWQGWWPAEDTPTNNNNNNEEKDAPNGCPDDAATTGSAQLRFNFARRAALQTTLNYAQELGHSCKARLGKATAARQGWQAMAARQGWQAMAARQGL